METFDPVTRQGLEIGTLFGFELLVSALLLALVLGWLVVGLVRFRARPGDATEPAQIHGNTPLEIAWTVVPALILAVVFVLVVQTMRNVEAAPAPGTAELVHVIGRQWWWEFRYSQGDVVTANELHVPVDTPVQFRLESADVIHSFWVPRFGMMRDVVPGKTNQLLFHVDRVGIYTGACTQYCGMQHAWMRIRVVADPRDQFDAWLSQQSQPASSGGSRGQQVFVQNTCVSCHTIRGVSTAGQVGPDLTHFGSRSTLGAGVLDNTPPNLRRWIRSPQLVKPGVLMPAYGNMDDADLDALVEFLGGLR